FPLHADGRRYAPMVAAKATKAWESKLAQRDRRAADRQRKRAAAPAPETQPAPEAALPDASPPDASSPDAAPPDTASPDTAPPDTASPDMASLVFTHGLAWLKRSTGKSESHCRGLLGRWRKAFAERGGGDAALIDALGRAQREGVIEPVGWIERALAQHRAAASSSSAGGWN
ncbi:MAG: hypothetical protein JSR90_01225, partial [Proteobacteria bacterium]|nr:hypothetical protein [Pseudomonadota bacterium]